MASKRAKSNRGRFFGKRRAKTVQLKVEEIGAIDPRASRDDAWAYFDLNFDFSRNQKPQLA
jgi:hypothetical protein